MRIIGAINKSVSIDLFYRKLTGYLIVFFRTHFILCGKNEKKRDKPINKLTETVQSLKLSIL